MTALNFFEDKIRSIEISKDGSKETVFFPKIPICDYRSPSLVIDFTNNADRSSS